MPPAAADPQDVLRAERKALGRAETADRFDPATHPIDPRHGLVTEVERPRIPPRDSQIDRLPPDAGHRDDCAGRCVDPDDRVGHHDGATRGRRPERQHCDHRGGGRNAQRREAEGDTVPVSPHAVPQRCARCGEGGILAQDPCFQLAQARIRHEPELVEELSPFAVALERLRLPAASVERQHQLAAQPLAQRVLRKERLELRNEHAVSTECEIGVETLFERVEPQLLETSDLSGRERLVGEIREGRASKQAERPSQE
jgi:hypothetical protein